MDKNSLIENVTNNAMMQKTEFALIDLVYRQSIPALLSSLFCALIIFLGLRSDPKINAALMQWFYIFIAITILRSFLVYLYKKNTFHNVYLYRQLYILGSFLGGISWGLAIILLLPQATPQEQTLVILMLAGVTAGVVPLSSPIPIASILFLICSLLPLIVSISFFNQNIYKIFNFSLALYLLYTIILSLKTHNLIKDSIKLQFENAFLVKNLFEIKNQLEFTNKKLEQFATHDPLTKLSNRLLFENIMEKSLQKAQKDTNKLAILYFDLDHFKPANDNYGHHVGDFILSKITERLKKLIRNEDMIFRVGGDEFAIILPNIHNETDAEHIAMRLCKLIAEPIHYDGIYLNISASVGISIFPDDGKNANDIIRNADKNMYHVKQRGGNNYFRAKQYDIEKI